MNFFGFAINQKYNRKTQTYMLPQKMSWEEFEETLKNPFYRPETSWPYEDLPEEIDIGKIGILGERLLKDSIDDPLHRERGTFIKVDVFDKLFARKAEFADVGTPFHVEINHVLESGTTYSYGDTSEKLAAVLHTHPRQYENQIFLDIPSFMDIAGLLSQNPSSPSISVIYIEQSKQTLTKGGHILLIRTKETPIMDYEDLEQWMHDHESKLQRMFHASEHAIELKAKEFILQVLHDKKIGIYYSEQDNIFKKV